MNTKEWNNIVGFVKFQLFYYKISNKNLSVIDNNGTYSWLYSVNLMHDNCKQKENNILLGESPKL